MTKGFGNTAACVSLTLTLAFGPSGAGGALAQQPAQQRPTAIWKIPFGTPASELPTEFRMPACGTHGGPPSTPLQGFEEFARCPAEPETGLHEVWFSYDDELEYYLRAIHTNPETIARYRANQLFDHLVEYSLLFDSQGRVQGYRIATDQREDPEIRADSDMLEGGLKVAFGAGGWTCTDLPPLAGEEPWGGDFVKRICEKSENGVYVKILAHRYLRPGQRAGRGGAPLANEFEVGTWVEAISADLVGKTAPR